MDPGGYITSDCLSDYNRYRDFLKKVSAMDIVVICLGHRYAFTGEDVFDYIRKATAHCEKFKDLVEKCLAQEHGDVKQVVQQIRQIEYDGRAWPSQPEPAYLLNLKARVIAVKNRFVS